jgi:DNA-binding NarL/FixJ family response regulator
METAVRVLIADDRTRSRKGLKALLSTYPTIHVIGEATNGRETMRMVEAYQPNVVVMDAKMPAISGLAATRAIKAQWPEIRIVMLTMYSSYKADAEASGADRFLVKGCPADELLEAILNHQEVHS